jgi:hypothetical protein
LAFSAHIVNGDGHLTRAKPLGYFAGNQGIHGFSSLASTIFIMNKLTVILAQQHVKMNRTLYAGQVLEGAGRAACFNQAHRERKDKSFCSER